MTTMFEKKLNEIKKTSEILKSGASFIFLNGKIEKEVWKPVNEPGFEDVYEVSDLGRVRSKDRIIDCNGNEVHRRGVILRSSINKQTGYKQVILSKNGNQKVFLVHRLVAEAFLPKKLGCNYVNHKDENKLNNCVENLEWCTQQYNSTYNNLTERRMRILVEHGYTKKVLIKCPQTGQIKHCRSINYAAKVLHTSPVIIRNHLANKKPIKRAFYVEREN